MTDPGGLGTVYELERGAWLRLAQRAGPDAEDAIQDAMVAALSGALPLPDEDLPAMCRRLVRTFARQGRRRARTPAGRVGALPTWEALTATQLRLEVQRAVDSAPHVSGPLIWAWLQGETLAHLAASHHQPVGAVRSQITRCLAHCAPRLTPYRAHRAPRGRPAVLMAD